MSVFWTGKNIDWEVEKLQRLRSTLGALLDGIYICLRPNRRNQLKACLNVVHYQWNLLQQICFLSFLPQSRPRQTKLRKQNVHFVVWNFIVFRIILALKKLVLHGEYFLPASYPLLNLFLCFVAVLHLYRFPLIPPNWHFFCYSSSCCTPFRLLSGQNEAKHTHTNASKTNIKNKHNNFNVN